MGRIIGIDLGTTNSVVAVMEGGEPTVIPNAEGGRTCPRSWPSPSRASGWSARSPSARRSPTPTNTVFSIKRFMGRRWDDPEVQRSKDLVPYKVAKDPNERRHRRRARGRQDVHARPRSAR